MQKHPDLFYLLTLNLWLSGIFIDNRTDFPYLQEESEMDSVGEQSFPQVEESNYKNIRFGVEILRI